MRNWGMRSLLCNGVHHSLRRLQAVLINIVKAESLCVWAKVLQPVLVSPAWDVIESVLNFAPTSASASAILRQQTDSYSRFACCLNRYKRVQSRPEPT